jgi:hypothetical protein
MIVKRVFNFKPLPPAGGRGRALEWGMPEALDVTCPCCEALLKVDPETGSVVWADRKKAPPKDFDDLVSRVQSQKGVLEKKFEEARKRAEADPTTKAPHPFDND